MRLNPALLALVFFVPALALAAGPAPAKKRAPPKVPAKVKATPTPVPEPAELSAADQAAVERFLEEGKSQFNRAEFLDARALFRKAAAIDPSNEEVKKRLAMSEEECLENAKRQISEAKVYKSANNTSEASAALELALKYADLPTYKEHRTIVEMQNALKRESER